MNKQEAESILLGLKFSIHLFNMQVDLYPAEGSTCPLLVQLGLVNLVGL